MTLRHASDQDGEVVAAASEERFTRKKHDSSFPANAIRYCLKEGALETSESLTMSASTTSRC